MRNITQYPITDAEKVAILRRMIDEKKNEEAIGDITVYALEQIIKDVYKHTEKNEDITDNGSFPS